MVLEELTLETICLPSKWRVFGWNLFNFCSKFSESDAIIPSKPWLGNSTSISYSKRFRFHIKIFFQFQKSLFVEKFVGNCDLSETKALSADFLLQSFICPAIVDPERYGITGNIPVSSLARSNLMQVAQVLFHFRLFRNFLFFKFLGFTSCSSYGSPW